MIRIATHPLTLLTTGTINPDGIDLVIAAAADLPEIGHSRYTVALHEDGAYCATECDCVDAEDRTTIWEDTEISRGEWTWHATRYTLIGLRKTGPTRTELRERIDYLETALTEEQARYDQVSGQLRESEDERRALEDVRQWQRRQLASASLSVLSGWGLAIIMAALLVCAVVIL